MMRRDHYRIKKRIYLLPLLLFFFTFPLYSQQYNTEIEYLSVQDGLSNGFVHHAMQDETGFMWFSTHYGLSKYNGHEFKNFTKANGLTTDRIVHTAEDCAGYIWVFHLGVVDSVGKHRLHVDILDPETSEITPFQRFFSEILPPDLAQNIYLLRQDEFNQIWIRTESGQFYKYDGAFQRLAAQPEVQKLELDHFPTFTFPKREELLQIEQFYTTLRRLGVQQFDFRFLEAGNVWMQYDNDVNKLYVPAGGDKINLLTFILSKINNQNNREIVMNRDPEGRIWIGLSHTQTLYIFDPDLHLIQEIKSNQIAHRIRSIYFDKNGIAWLPTDNGVYKVIIKKSAFTNFLTAFHAVDTRGILVDSTGVIYANQWATYAIRGTVRTVTQQSHNVGLFKEGPYLWISSYSDTLRRYDLRTGTQRLLKLNREDVIQGNLFYKSKKSNILYAGTSNGLFIIDTLQWVGESFTKVNEYHKFATAHMDAVYENDEGIWVATSKGIYLLNETQGIIQSHFTEFRILHIMEDKAGIFWLATYENGLIRWNRETNQIQHFTTKDGLSHNTIYAIYEDDYGYLWLPSQKGLNRFKKATNTVSNIYMPENGLPHEEFNTYAHTQAPDGRLLFGGFGGVTTFHPQDFIDGTAYNIPLIVTSFQKQDPTNGLLKDYTASYSKNKQLVLQPGEKSFLLRFALLDYQHLGANKYWYKIEGLDKTWNTLNENDIRIGGLPYGNYTIRIKAKGAEGRWAPQELVIPLIVKHPFYRTFWFGAICLVMSALAVWGFVKVRTRQLKQMNIQLEMEVSNRTLLIQKQAEALKALDEKKFNFFTNMAHELRTPLTMMLAPIEHALAKEQLSQSTEKLLVSLQRNARYLSNLTEIILDMAKLDSKILDLQEMPVRFPELIRQLFAMHESYAESQQIDYQLHLHTRENLHMILDQKKVAHIIHNLIANALKFTPSGGRVVLDVTELDQAIQVKITDTGIGIPAADLPYIFDRYYQVKRKRDALQGGSGIGLAMAKEYAHLMQGSLTVESAEGRGSTFIFTFPLKKTNPLPVSVNPDPNRPAFMTAKSNATEPRPSAQSTLLIVEDNVDLQQFMKELLEPDYQIVLAGNGKEALRKLNIISVDCIITDIMMPEMDGFEFVATLKQNNAWADIPVIAVTAKTDEQKKLEGLRLGMDDYLYKPFSPAELTTRVNNLLANYEKRKTQRKTIVEKEEMTRTDQRWLQELEACTLNLLKKNTNFTLYELADCMHLSERHLRRKMQQITGMSAIEYVKELRLQYARKLLENRAKPNVTEVSYAVGFSTVKYFTQIYKERFGKVPSEYFKSV